MTIKTIMIEEIRRAKYNPRKTLKPGDPAFEKLKKAVDTFGLVEPLVWNERTGNLVGGHQRLSILELRGDTHVEVSVVDLDERAEKTLNLALNKQGGEWDFATLADLLQDLDTGDVDMELTGFGVDELEKMMTWLPPNLGLTAEDAVPEPPTETVTKAGDLWQLGPHLLLCGDATFGADVARLLGAVQPGLMVTDPPYGVSYDPDWRNVARRKGSMGALGASATGKVQNDERSDWRGAWSLFPGAIAYVWHGGLHAGIVAESLHAADLEIRGQIIWAKQHAVISRGHYHWQHEPCWYAVRKSATGNWQGDRKQTTVWQIANSNAFGGQNKEEQTNHGTQKPVECMRRPILNHTNPGQCVYDPFIGSGTTIIAAETTGRVCLGIDIDPVYVDVAVKRWEEFTGLKAERA